MTFKDHFSGHAAQYARHRPDYPPELYDYLATLTPRRDVVLDCATGSGQAALGLAQRFALVVGTDGSVRQLRNAHAAPRVTYVANLAERPAFRDGSIDLVTVAQAAHWFDHDRFYPEVKRVLRPEGALAIWTYGMASIGSEIDSLMDDFYNDQVGEYWPPERTFVESGYANMPFPFREEPAPATMRIRMQWSLEDFISYVRTWSAVQRFIEARGADPVTALCARIESLWGAGQVRPVSWPLHLRVGRP